MSAAPEALSLLAIYGLFAAAAAGGAAFLRRRVPAGLLAFAIALPLVLLAPDFFGGKTPIPADHAFLTVPAAPGKAVNSWGDDVARQFAPWAKAVRDAWRSGALPHRNRWSGCGMTLDANGSSAAYSPFTAATFLVPLPAAFGLSAAIRILLCFVGAWLWLTELSVSVRAAAFGAVAVSLSLSLTAWLSFPQTAVLSLWPWVLFAIERLRDRPVRGRAAITLTGLFFLWPLCGHLETVASAAGFTALWLGARRILGERGILRETAPPIAGAAVAALGLTAFSVLPQALAIRASNRLALVEHPFWQPILSAAPHGPAWRWGLFVPILPRLFGDRITSPVVPGGAGAFPEMALGYVGILPAALALLIFRPGSKRFAAERALLVPLIFGFGAAVGAWPFAELAALVPGLSRMFPLRYLTWFALAAAAIAAFELDRLARDLESRPSARFFPLACAGAVALLGALAYRRFAPAYAAAGALTAQRNAFLLPAAALAAGAAAAALAGGSARRFRTAGIPLLAAIAAAELLRQGSRLLTRDDPAALYPATPLVRYLQSRPRPFRILGEGSTIFPNVGVFAGLEDVRTHDPVERRDYVEFLDATCGYDPKPYFKRVSNVNAPALDFLNVRYLVSSPGRAAPGEKWRPVYSGPDGTVFESASVLPRVFAPKSVRVVRASPSRALAGDARTAYGVPYGELFRELRWSEEAVVLEESPGALAASGPPPEAAVSEYAETTNRISFRVRSEPAGPAAVLVSSLVEDGGWRARGETGERIERTRANGPFLAIRVPAGDRRVVLEYASPGFRAGAAVSAATLAGGAALAALFLARRRRRAAG